MARVSLTEILHLNSFLDIYTLIPTLNLNNKKLIVKNPQKVIFFTNKFNVKVFLTL